MYVLTFGVYYPKKISIACESTMSLAYLLMFLAPACTCAYDVSRLMNNTNFPSHNLPNGGCNPDVRTENFTTAVKCQKACDALHACDVREYTLA